MNAGKAGGHEDFTEEDYFKGEEEETGNGEPLNEGSSEADPLDMFMADMEKQKKTESKTQKASRVDLEDIEDPLDVYLNGIKQKETGIPKRKTFLKDFKHKI
jgi:hypothetical protein